MLPAQSSGGTRHSAIKGLNSGETQTEPDSFAASAQPINASPSNDFADTFHKALKLSHEDVAKILQPEKPAQLPLSQNLSGNTGLSESEKNVDAATPLAIAQFTSSNVDAVSFAQGSAQTINLQRNRENTADGIDLKTGAITPTLVSSDGYVPGFEMSHSKSSDFISLRGEVIPTIDSPQNAPIQRLGTQTFETIKGQIPRTLSASQSVTENLAFPVAAMPFDDNMIGDVRVESDVTFLDRPNALNLSMAIGSEASDGRALEAELLSINPQAITVEGQRQTLGLDRIEPIGNFRSALTQEDLERIINNRNLPSTPQLAPDTYRPTETLIPVIEGLDGSENVTEVPVARHNRAEVFTDELDFVSAERPFNIADHESLTQRIDAPRAQSETNILERANFNYIKSSSEDVDTTETIKIPETLTSTYEAPTPRQHDDQIAVPNAEQDVLPPIAFEQISELDSISSTIAPLDNKRAEFTDIDPEGLSKARQLDTQNNSLSEHGIDLAQQPLSRAVRNSENNIDVSDAALRQTTEQDSIEPLAFEQEISVDSISAAIAPHDNKRAAVIEASPKDRSSSNRVDVQDSAAKDTVVTVEDKRAEFLETASEEDSNSSRLEPSNSALTEQDTDVALPPAYNDTTIAVNNIDQTEMALQAAPQDLKNSLPNEVILENNRGTISLANFQMGASRESFIPVVETTKKINHKDVRDIEPETDIDADASSSDIREVEIQIDEIDASDFHFDQIDSDLETTSSPSQFGQTALSPVAMSTGSSPIFQPMIGLGGELMSPLALQAQNLSQTSTTLAQSPTVRQAVVTTVSDAILTAKETPKGIVVQLDPPEMGRVYIDFLFEGDNNVTVVMKSDSVDSQAILRERQDHFQALLKDSGFENITMSFEQQSSENPDGSNSDNSGKDINIGLAAQTSEAQSDSYNQPIYQVSDDAIRLDMRL